MNNGPVSPTIASLHRPRWLLALCLGVAVSGCVTPWEKYALNKETYPNIERVQGPTERNLRRLQWWKKQEEAAEDSESLKPLAGTEDYLAATELYKNEEYDEARKAFKRVAKKYKRSEIREDALFMQGESEFQQGHYSAAHDRYATLLKEYPSSRHLDVVSERLFKIGRIWLDFPEVAKLDEIQQVNYDEPRRKLPAETPPPPNRTPVFVPNFTNKERPLFDTPGNGVAALQAIWMNDPTGPLADDAMMLVASHYARHGNYIESDRYFRMLRETFPSSPHLKDAFLIGSHVKLMAYQGADYDDKTLHDARMLKESTLRLYPEIHESERLKDELSRIEDAEAEVEWQQVDLWIRKGNKRAAAVMCHQLISHHPKSARAEQARETLAKMGPEYSSGAVLLAPVDPPPPPLWRRVMGLPAATPPVAAADRNFEPAPASEAPRSRWNPNPFRRNPTAEEESEAMEPDSESVEEPESVPADDEPADEAEPESPRKRGWRWSVPRLLPSGTDNDARKLESADAGRSEL